MIVRELQLKDIFQVHRMYDSLSDQNKRFFHPTSLGLRSINARWLLAQLALGMSTFRFLRELLLRIFPFAVFLPLIAISKQSGIVGYAYAKIERHLPEGGLLGQLGVCVMDDYQGKGIGSKLMKSLMSLAKNNHVQKIYLIVLTENTKAIHMYEKYGFKRTRVIKGGNVWRGKRLDCVEMYSDLHWFFNPADNKKKRMSE